MLAVCDRETIDVLVRASQDGASGVRSFVAAKNRSPKLYTPEEGDILDTEDTTLYQRDYLSREPIKPMQNVIVLPSDNELPREVADNYTKAPKKKIGVPTDKTEKGVDIDSRKEDMTYFEMVHAFYDFIGESLLRTGKRLPPDERERLANELDCNPLAKVSLQYAQSTSPIPNPNFNLSRMSLN